MKKTLLLFCAALSFQTVHAATLTYPGAAPCNTTLQACITSATAGDTIEIASNLRINENITFSKSLTIQPASGFAPLLGHTDATTPKTITIDDAGAAGGSVTVRLKNLTLDAAKIDLTFNAATDHIFELSGSTLNHTVNSNNETGVDVHLSVPSTVLIQNNTLQTTGQPLQIFTALASGSATIDILGNTFTTTDPSESHEGIQFRSNGPGGGTGQVTANIFSNVIYGIGGCSCGANAGIDVETTGSGTYTVNLLNNTIDNVQGSGTGIYVNAPGAGTNTTTLNIYNNNVTNASGEGIRLPASNARLSVNNDFNNFFGNASLNFGGFAQGANDLTVDPLYIDAALRNYRLRSTSTLVNNGFNSAPAIPVNLDRDQTTRVVGGTTDIGAYEMAADLALSGSSTTNPTDAQQEIFLFVATNNGSYDADNTDLVITSTTNTLLLNVAASQGSCSTSANTTTCHFGTLAANANATAALTFEANALGNLNGEVSSSVPDPNTLNNTFALASPSVSASAGATPTSGGCSTVPHSGSVSLLNWIFPLLGLFLFRRFQNRPLTSSPSASIKEKSPDIKIVPWRKK